MEKAKETGTDQELMRSMKVSKAVAAMAIPSVISSLVTVVYNMADTFFVGQTGDALQVAAVSLTNPIFILLMAFANMFGMGGSAVASMAMGEGKPKKVKNTTAFITYASLAVGIIIAVILFAFMSPILHIFGANTETYEYAKGYIHYIAWGAPFIIWSAAASFVVRAEGASKEAMIGSMVGTIANIVLDPLFIYWSAYGSCRCGYCNYHRKYPGKSVFCMVFLERDPVSCPFFQKTLHSGENIPQRVCTTGFPTAIFSVLMSVSTIVVNQILVKYGNAPVAAIGIVFKANMFITFPANGTGKRSTAIVGLQLWSWKYQPLPGSRTLYEDLLPDSRSCGHTAVFCGKRAVLSACSSVMMRWFIMG